MSFFALVPPTVSVPSTSTSSTATQTSSCQATTVVDNQTLTPSTFGGVTEFTLPESDSTPNAPLVEPDGSIWFAENGLPGVAHLYPNGTLDEYKLPFETTAAGNECGEIGYIWGVAVWNGSVWAADEDQAQLEGVNPSTGQITNITITTPYSSSASPASPYTLAVGPDGDLWLTLLVGGPYLARITPGTDAVQYLQFPGNASWSSAYVTFANSTTGYLLAVNPFNVNPTVSDVNSIIYSFDPESPDPTFTEVGSNATLYEPSSIAVGEGGIWVTEHAGSANALFNETTDAWTIYPTSTVPYVPTTLTYFDASNGTTVWFNEHYGNKIGEISDSATKLTEYSLADPPNDNFTQILTQVNTLMMAQGDGRTWFTQWSANVVGFVNQSYVPPFSLSANEYSAQIQAGTTGEVQLQLSGQVSSNLSLQFSDNEFNNGTTKDIAFTPSVSSLSSLSGTQSITVTISVSNSLEPGEYVAALTVSDGLVLQSVYVTLDVTASATPS